MAKTARLRVGTSGWSYPHWRGRFYPPGLPQAQWFAHYAATFDAVEINNSFYRVPKPETVDAWRAAAPEGFVFAVKCNRFITHMKKLKEPEDAARRFLDVVTRFGSALGPILFQLPPRWRFDGDRLRDFLAFLPKGLRYAFEFRDPSWINDRCLGLLADKGAALCLSDLAGRRAPLSITADFVYFRLHGPNAAYQGLYGPAGLAPLAETVREQLRAGREAHCYFDNDQEGFAAADAALLAAMLENP